MSRIGCSVILFVLILSCSFVWPMPSKVAYPVQKFSMKGILDIQIIGVKGTVKLRGDSKASLMSFKVQHSAHKRFDDWQLAMDRRGDTLFIEVLSLLYGKKWRSQLRADQWPEFDIELSGPSRPTVVSWREGSLEFRNWNASLDVTFLRGRAKVVGGKGVLNLHPLQANVEVSQRKGNVMIRGESGDLKLKQIVGNLNLNWFKGSLLLRDCRGEVNIDSQDSQVRVLGGAGKLVLNLPKGHADVFGFKGVINGTGQHSSWGIQASAPTEVNLTSETGMVDIAWQGGARVFLTSTDGELNTIKASNLRSAVRDGRKVWVGQKSGKINGDVFVRTQSGKIVWR